MLPACEGYGASSPTPPAQAMAGREQPNDSRPLFASGPQPHCEFDRENQACRPVEHSSGANGCFSSFGGNAHPDRQWQLATHYRNSNRGTGNVELNFRHLPEEESMGAQGQSGARYGSGIERAGLG